jgi:hypothetical protein
MRCRPVGRHCVEEPVRGRSEGETSPEARSRAGWCPWSQDQPGHGCCQGSSEDQGMRHASMGKPMVIRKSPKAPQPVDVRKRGTDPRTDPVPLRDRVGQHRRPSGEAGDDM